MRVHSVHSHARPITYISSVHRPRSRNSRSVTESELRSLNLGVRERYRLHIVDPRLIYRLLHKARGSQSLLSSHRCHISWFEIKKQDLGSRDMNKAWNLSASCPIIFNPRNRIDFSELNLRLFPSLFIYVFRCYIQNKIIMNLFAVINTHTYSLLYLH